METERENTYGEGPTRIKVVGASRDEASDWTASIQVISGFPPNLEKLLVSENEGTFWQVDTYAFAESKNRQPGEFTLVLRAVNGMQKLRRGEILRSVEEVAS